MAGDLPLLDRLRQLPPVAAAETLELLTTLADPGTDPLIGQFFGLDEDGDPAVSALVPGVLQQLEETPGLTCYDALVQGLTGVWNAAVRAAVVARLRAAGLPLDDLLLRLQKLSPTLGFTNERQDWSREWLADPSSQDTLLVQQCLVRLLFALRALAEARAGEITAAEG